MLSKVSLKRDALPFSVQPFFFQGLYHLEGLETSFKRPLTKIGSLLISCLAEMILLSRGAECFTKPQRLIARDRHLAFLPTKRYES